MIQREVLLQRKRDTYRADRENNLVRMKEYRETPRGCAVLMWNRAKDRAKTKGVPFSITVEDIAAQVDAGVCTATGLPLDFTQGLGRSAGHRPFAPSLDRINPALGYTPENSRVVCWSFNAAKGTGTDEHVIQMAAALISRRTQ